MAERSLPVGAKRQLILDAGVPVQYVDTISEATHGNGIIALSFGAGVIDADNETVMTVAARLRMHLGTAQFLHKLLGDMIADELKPSDKTKAN